MYSIYTFLQGNNKSMVSNADVGFDFRFPKRWETSQHQSCL